MIEAIKKDYNEAKKNGLTLLRESLSPIINKINSGIITDDQLSSLLELMIIDKAKKIVQIVNNNKFKRSRIELLVYSQQVLNNYLNVYKFGYYRQISYNGISDDFGYERHGILYFCF